MKRFAFISAVIGLLLMMPQSVYAHQMGRDGSTSAILHIDPDDDPIAGQPSTLFFDFSDSVNPYLLSNCQCVVNILENGHIIHSEQLVPSKSAASLYNASFQYIFPTKD